MAPNTIDCSNGANLLSCGGLGFVRFWNTTKGELVGEFQAHSDGIKRMN